MWTANSDNDGSVSRLVPPLAGGVTKIFERIGSGLASFVVSNPFGAVLSMVAVLAVGILSIRVWFDLRKDKFLRTQEYSKNQYKNKQSINNTKIFSQNPQQAFASSGSFGVQYKCMNVSENGINSTRISYTHTHKPRFSKRQKTTAGLALAVVALFLVFVSLFNSNWQLSFGIKNSVDLNNKRDSIQRQIGDGFANSPLNSTDNSEVDDLLNIIAKDGDESVVSDQDGFLYSLLFSDIMLLGYDVLAGFAITSSGQKISGLIYTDYEDILQNNNSDQEAEQDSVNQDNSITKQNSDINTNDDINSNISVDANDENNNSSIYIGAGFVALLDQDTSEIDVESGVVLEPVIDEENVTNHEFDYSYILSIEQEFKTLHYVAYDEYVQYSVEDFGLHKKVLPNEKSQYDESLGYLYNYDRNLPLIDPDIGKEFNPDGFSLNDTINYSLTQDVYKAFSNEQLNNGMRVDNLSLTYISMEAINEFMANNQQESFLGISPEEIYYIQANLPDSYFYYVDENGETQILEIPPDPAQKATIWERILTAIAVVGVVVLAVVIVIATAGAAAPILIGAAVGFGVEIIMQVVVGGIPPKDINWAKVAVSTVAGAFSAIPGLNWAGAGLIMGSSQAAMAWLDGGDLVDILLAFGVGFATGVVIHFATKALSKLTSKLTNKLNQITETPTGKSGFGSIADDIANATDDVVDDIGKKLTSQQIGKQGEETAKMFGLQKNTKWFKIFGRTRIPDGVVYDDVGNIIRIQEVKNVAKLTYTRQLKDFVAIADREGVPFELFVRKGTDGVRGTTLSKILEKLKDAGKIIVQEVI